MLILTEGTGCAADGALGIYRGQRGRMQIEVEVTGKSCHGSMPWEGRNPLEYGGAIVAEAAQRYREGEGFGNDDFLGAGSRTASWASLETPSDCAVPERFTFRLDRRLTAGEDPEQARRDIETCPRSRRPAKPGSRFGAHPGVRTAHLEGLSAGQCTDLPGVGDSRRPSRRSRPRRPPIARWSRRRSPMTRQGAGAEEPRVSRWVFSTDGVGVPLPAASAEVEVPANKRWIEMPPYHHPAMFGIGPGIEQNTHKIGEYVDTRELAPVIAFLTRFPTAYREQVR